MGVGASVRFCKGGRTRWEGDEVEQWRGPSISMASHGWSLISACVGFFVIV